MKMWFSNILLSVLLCSTLLVLNAIAIYLPERADNQLNAEAYMQPQHTEHKHAISQRIHHKSYDLDLDKNDDDTLHQTDELNRKKRELSEWFIAPNTRWCGRGNLANGTYNALGGSSADKCCRKHDLACKLYIPGMSNRYELFNYRPYTLSHCNCDRRFRTCLKMVNDDDAKTIGKLFFNVVQTQCFVLRPKIVCQQRAENGTCLKEHRKQKAYLKNNQKF